MQMKHYIEKCVEGFDLTTDEAAKALDLIMTGQATDAQIAGLLMALRAKGETVDEVVGFAQTMREKSVKVNVGDANAIDMCGTGGDGAGTFNISTVASFVAAGAGVTVAKHGNKSVSSRSGSADVLSALGVNINLTPEQTGNCIDSIGVGFMFAPLFHPAMKFAAKPRAELGVRTIFNIVGPLTNPAGVRRQLLGTYHARAATMLAGALQKLHVHKACVVHSDDGLDEVAVSGDTNILEISEFGEMQSYIVSPQHFGFELRHLSTVRGGEKEENAAIAMEVLQGHDGAKREIVVANAAFGIYVAGKADTITEAAAKAGESIDSGRALKKFNDFREYSLRA